MEPTVSTGLGDRTVDPTSDRPVYKQIADIIHERIDVGAFAPGDQLPSATELMEHFGVARLTVGRALDRLKTEGLVDSEQGVGVFVSKPSPAILLLRPPGERLKRRHREHGKSPLEYDAEQIKTLPGDDAEHIRVDLNQQVVKLEEVRAPADVAERLEISGGDLVFVRRRLIWAVVTPHASTGDSAMQGSQRVPTHMADSYLPLDIAQGQIREIDTGPGGTYARIEEAGHLLTHFTEGLSARMPLPDEVRLLRLRPGIPVVDFVRVAYAGERPVECFVAVMAGDKHRFEYTIPAD